MEKYCYDIMPFVPKNAPAVYTAMMKILKSEYDALFLARHPEFVSIIGNKNVMDDTLLYMPNGMPLLLPLRVRDLQEIPSIVQPKEVRLLQTAVQMAGPRHSGKVRPNPRLTSLMTGHDQRSLSHSHPS